MDLLRHKEACSLIIVNMEQKMLIIVIVIMQQRSLLVNYCYYGTKKPVS